MKEEKQATDDTVEEQVRRGLVMRARRVLKDDGRYLLYFEFDRAPAVVQDSR